MQLAINTELKIFHVSYAVKVQEIVQTNELFKYLIANSCKVLNYFCKKIFIHQTNKLNNPKITNYSKMLTFLSYNLLDNILQIPNPPHLSKNMSHNKHTFCRRLKSIITLQKGIKSYSWFRDFNTQFINNLINSVWIQLRSKSAVKITASDELIETEFS